MATRVDPMSPELSEMYYYLRQWGFRHRLFVCLSVSNFVQKLRTNLPEIFSECWQWANEQMTKFRCRSGSPSIRGLFSGFDTIGRYGKWLTDINVLLILIHQMAALARRALAEVCTVPVLPLYYGRPMEWAGHYIFVLWFLLLVYSSIFFFFSSPILSRRRLDVYHTSVMVWP